MSYDAEILKEALRDAYFQRLVEIRDEQMALDKPDPVVMAKLKVEMAKTGYIDGFILKWKEAEPL